MQIITTHTASDFDALASLVAAGKLYPEAKICFPGSLSREVKDFMHLYGEMIPLVKIEERNISQIKRLIIVDTRWINRIGIFRKVVEKREAEIHLYDHHPDYPEDIQEDWGLCKEVGATTSILVELIKKKKIFITPFEVTLFALGIYEDTGSLSFSSTTPLDLESVSFLLSQGANLEFISSFLNRQLTEEQVLLLNAFLKEAKIHRVNGAEVVIIIAKIDKFVGGLSLPLHKFINLKNPDVVFALIEAKTKVYLLARSRTTSVNVGDILSSLGGGGHNFAASSLIKDKDIREIEVALYEVLKKKIKPQLTIDKIMKTVPEIVSTSTSLKDAKKIMQVNNLSVLPVGEKGKVMGTISREQIERVVTHNLDSVPLKGYFSRKFFSISPFTSLKRAQEIMIEKELSYLLVFENDNLVGIITSFDLLNTFYGGEKKEKLIKGQNVKDILKRRVPLKIMRILTRAGQVGEKMGYRVFIVGGFVRDTLLEIENLDIDLVVEGEGISFARELSRELGAHILVHQEFGTATLKLPGEFKLDIATSRKEFYPEPAALPKIQPASLKEDSFRRDFTTNSMAISINPKSFGELIDFFGGREDLKKKKVRVLHSQSFIDDPTRIFRAIKFEQRYGFHIEKNTQKLIKFALEDKVFHKLSGKRVKEELIQILEEDYPEKNLDRMEEIGILKIIHPKIHLTKEKKEISNRLIDVIAIYETLWGKRIRRWLVRLCVLLENLEIEEITQLSSKYTFRREERQILIGARKDVKSILKELKAPKILPSFIYYLLQPFPSEILLLAMAKTTSKIVKKRMFSYLSHLQKVKVEVNGEDLKKLGYKPSPKFSQVLEEVKKAKLNEIVKTKEEELAFIKEKFGNSSATKSPGHKGVI
ncbi:CBS domain-containing protein [Patescibacteria group bacterium]|nr:CBS domain-containing protein [Patescibacteria group bacterium]